MLSIKRNGIQSDRYLKKKRKKTAWVLSLSIVALGSLLVASILFFKADFLQIRQVNITPSLITPEDQILADINKNLSGSWSGLFSKNNLFLYPKDTIRTDILHDFPRIQSVSFGHSGLSVLDVNVTERTPYALACTGPSSTDSCFYMDSSGYIYALAPQFSDGVYVRYLIDAASSTTDSSSPVAVGRLITDPSRFAVAHQSTDYISQMGIKVIAISIDDNDNYSIDINGFSTTTSTVYLDMSAPLDTTLQYFSTFWQNRSDKDFDYIDLRYGKDIVFKMKQ